MSIELTEEAFALLYTLREQLTRIQPLIGLPLGLLDQLYRGLTALELDYVAVRVSHVGKTDARARAPRAEAVSVDATESRGQPERRVGEDRTCRNARVGGRDWG
jgi:hypothetical protein